MNDAVITSPKTWLIILSPVHPVNVSTYQLLLTFRAHIVSIVCRYDTNHLVVIWLRFMGLVDSTSNYTKSSATTTTNSPKEVLMPALVNCEKGTISYHNVNLKYIIDC